MSATILDCEAKRETEKALLVWIEDWGEEKWIPKSVIESDSDVWGYDDEDARGPGKLVVADWFAEKEDLV